jgi:hypothetical protein
VGKKKLKLKANHTWKCKPGNSICAIERGLVRFEFPSHWIAEPGEGAMHLHDQKPSVESCDLGVSIFPKPMAHFREFPLDEALINALGSDRKPYEQSEIRHIKRADLDIAWLEQKYIEEEYKRDARFRVALARGPLLVLITMNYWSDRAPGLEPVWDDVLRSIMFGERVADPTKGPLLQ